MSLLLKRRGPIRAEINVTSLLDITMCILCVFILVAPIIEQGIDVTLPKASATQLEQPEEPVTVSLQEVEQGKDKRGVIFVDRRQMDRSRPFEDLRETLIKLQQERPKMGVIIRADKDFKYETVIKVLDVVRSAGIVTLSLATQAD